MRRIAGRLRHSCAGRGRAFAPRDQHREHDSDAAAARGGPALGFRRKLRHAFDQASGAISRDAATMRSAAQCRLWTYQHALP